MQALAKKLRDIFDLEGSGRLIFYSAVVGVVSGCGAALFYWLLHLAQGYFLGDDEWRSLADVLAEVA